MIRMLKKPVVVMWRGHNNRLVTESLETSLKARQFMKAHHLNPMNASTFKIKKKFVTTGRKL